MADGPATVVELTDTNAESILAQAQKPVIIDFYGTWCPPCRQMAPIFEKLAELLKDTYLFAKADCSKALALGKKYEVALLPTFAVIKDQKLLGKVTSTHTQEVLQEKIAQIIKGIDLTKLDKKALTEKLKEALSTAGDVKALIDAGVNVNDPFEDGMSPLIFACTFLGNFGDKGLEIIKQLLDAGASMTVSFNMGGTCESTEIGAFVEQLIANYARSIENYKKVATLLSDHKTKNQTACTGQACPIK
jgi:thioredoxin 1